MAKKYLDYNGALYFWAKIKAYVTSTMPTTAAEVGAIPASAKGAASGVCPLDANGKVDTSYLPTYNGGVS